MIEQDWIWGFVGGLLIGLGGAVYLLVNGRVMGASGIVGGLVDGVGIGTRLANGCTSGHGVCGISRLSLRGITATVFYIGAGGITMVLFRHVLGVI